MISSKMAVAGDRRVSFYTLLAFLLFSVTSQRDTYYVPDVKIDVYKPKGIKVSGPNIPDLRDFSFHANVNQDIDILSKGSIRGSLVEVPSAWNSRLEFEDREVQLKIGDVLHYYLTVTLNEQLATYANPGLNYTVTELKERVGDLLPIVTTSRPKTTTKRPKKCYPTLTTVRGGKACGGQTIFEDKFDTLREDVWQIEQYIPVTSHPEHPFVSYIDMYEEPLVFVANGSLHITPKILQHIDGFVNETIYLGELFLDDESGCTSRGEECRRKASGSDILPPVLSGRVTSQFAFKYGTVHVRAKLPQGDWLYPEILLEPFLKKYGLYNYASGVLKIAAARGNKELTKGADRYDNGVLYGGPVMDVQCRQQLMTTKAVNGLWGDDFHTYSLTWTPNYISLSVDFEEWAHIKPAGSLLARFPRSCTGLPRDQLQKGSKMAPFDDDFILTLGVAAGGITEFPDESLSSGRPKPWRGASRNGLLAFWQDLPTWERSWNQPRLIIDYVKIVAL